MRKIRILAIAPYEGMRLLLLETAKLFDDIECNAFVGNLGQGLLLARHNFYNDYDIIISRGGTASMLKSQLDIPVIEIETSPLDVLRAMRVGGNVSETCTVIGFPNIISNVDTICQLMKTQINTLSINDKSEVENLLKTVPSTGDHMVIGDMIAYTTALKLGLNAVLIQAGKECVEAAFMRARQLYYTHQNLREENRFLRNLIWKHMNHTVVFDENGEIFLSTLENNNEPIITYLREERNRQFSGDDCHIIKQISNIRYSIHLTKEYITQKEYTVYYFTENKVSLPDIRRGIRYLGQEEAQKEFNDSIYGVVGMDPDIYQEVELVNKSDQPLLIYGEDGTCKEQICKYVYLQSRWNNRPLVVIDSYMLNNKEWDYLMDHHNSPMAQDGCTIYFKNIDVLSVIQRCQLIANLLEMNVCKRNRVIFSGVCNKQGSVTETGKNILEALCCVCLFVAPLCFRRNQISLLANKYLNYMNIRLTKPLIGIETDALRLLEDYEWPHNYTQFQRVMEELVTVSQSSMLNVDEVQTVLKKENIIATVSEKAEDANINLDLNQTLDKINYDIVCKVLEEEQGNKSAASDRLGISRSTLWRFLKKNQ